MIEREKMIEAVARAICSSAGREPDAPFLFKGKPMDFPEWHRWEAEATAAVKAMHEYLKGADCYWDGCEECGVGHTLDQLGL